MALPTEKTKPKLGLWQHPILLYGPPKIGKSTLLAEIPDNLFFNTGGGLDALEVFQVPIPTWEAFEERATEFLAGGHSYKVLTIDTIDRLHKLAITKVITDRNISHPQDLEFGKGYDLVKDLMMRPLMKLALSKYGFILVSHTKEVEITSRIRKYTKTMPTLQDHVWQLVDSITGIIMLYDTETDKENNVKRVLRVKPNESYIAGDRTGRLAKHGDILLDDGKNNWAKIENIFTGPAPQQGLKV